MAKKLNPTLNIIFRPDGDEIEFGNIEGLTVVRLQRAFRNSQKELRKIRMKLIVDSSHESRQAAIDKDIAKEKVEQEKTNETDEVNEDE